MVQKIALKQCFSFNALIISSESAYIKNIKKPTQVNIWQQSREVTQDEIKVKHYRWHGNGAR